MEASQERKFETTLLIPGVARCGASVQPLLCVRCVVISLHQTCATAALCPARSVVRLLYPPHPQVCETARPMPRAAKRKAEQPPPAPAPSPEPDAKTAALLAWLRECGAEGLDDLHIRPDGLGGLCVFARRSSSSSSSSGGSSSGSGGGSSSSSSSSAPRLPPCAPRRIFAAGDRIASLPQRCVLSARAAEESELGKAVRAAAAAMGPTCEALVTEEVPLQPLSYSPCYSPLATVPQLQYLATVPQLQSLSFSATPSTGCIALTLTLTPIPTQTPNPRSCCGSSSLSGAPTLRTRGTRTWRRCPPPRPSPRAGRPSCATSSPPRPSEPRSAPPST